MSVPLINLGASGGKLAQQLAGLSNWHGLFAGATGTGKTLTMQMLAKGGSRRQSAAEALVKSAARSIGCQLGRQIIRGVLGSIFAKR